MTLSLGETWQPWHPSVRRGVMDDGGGPIEVLALLAPWRPSAVTRARQAIGDRLGLEAPGVLTLLDIRNHHDRLAWIYEAADVISIAHLTGDRMLGPRAAAELVCLAGRVAAEHGHPGPEPEDVLLTEEGEILLTGFVRPFPGVLGPPAPGEGSEEAILVFRLGALLAFLLGGPLPMSSTPEAHEGAIRRARIRAMSRPGAVFSEPYGNWLRGMLAWEPSTRPPLTRVLEGLAQLVDATAGPRLAGVTKEHFTGWMIVLVAAEPDDSPLPSALENLQDIVDPVSTAEVGRRTLGDEQVLGDLRDEDDPTVDSDLGRVTSGGTPPSIIERGSIPVAVGPPAEVAARRPTLPPGFFGPETEETDGPVSGLHTVTPAPRTRISQPLAPQERPAWFVPVSVTLGAVALVLGAWLLWG